MTELQKECTTRLTGVVLAGGISSRLGKDKATLPFIGGEDFLTRSVKLLRGLLPKVLVAGRIVPELDALDGVECIPDVWPQSGPASGIASALRHSGTDCLALSCDLPFMTTPVLENLIAAWANKAPATLLCAYAQKETGKTENLVGIYAFKTLPLLEEALKKKLLKISLVIPPEKTELMEYHFQDSLPFFNINYPADLLIAHEYLRLKNQH